MNLMTSWQWWAMLSALFAALTAIFAKVGVENIDSDLATLVRTVIILMVLTGILLITGKLNAASLLNLSPRSLLFLILSGLATGASWLCYFRALKVGDAAQVAPIDKLSVVMVAIFGAVFLGEQIPTMGWAGVTLIGLGAVMVALSR
jgi:transporter family protein